MRLFLIAFLALATCSVSFAQPEVARRKRNFNTENYVAMREFDPVSYFQNSPRKGSSKFAYTHLGITYYFVNGENLEIFKKDPDKYEPAYGGWCAYTVAQNGNRVKISASSWKIIDGKLHLFYNFNGDDRLRKWNQGNEKALKSAADRNWLAKMH